MRLGEYLTSINHTKENLFDMGDPMVEKEYTPFVINRCLSYFPDTIMQANEQAERDREKDALRFSVQFDPKEKAFQ
jgi:hypothetical protein